MSSFNKIFKITTFGESHCDAVGVIIDGCPSNLNLNENDIQYQLNRRRPGQSSINTPRDEKDKVLFLSGIEHGKTLGTPICGIVKNNNIKKNDYPFLNKEKYIPRPSHADFTYISKYGNHASSGGGRSSARETIGRVIGGEVAYKYLKEKFNIEIVAWVNSVGNISIMKEDINLNTISRKEVDKNIVRFPNQQKAEKIIDLVHKLKEDGDSIGGTVSCVCRNIPIGLGEPCFDKLEALLAHAMLSIPATKGFEFGSGFEGTKMKGSQHNDEFIKKDNGKIGTKTNFSGGIQGGISNGEDIYFTVAFKPPSTISKKQNTVLLNGDKVILEARGRHDPCIVNRAVPIVEAMASLVILDNLLYQKTRNI